MGTVSLSAQPKYWILLKDKDTTDYDYRKHLSQATIDKRQRLGLPLSQYTDIPLNPKYLQHIQREQIRPIARSRWLNAVSAKLTEYQRDWLSRQSYVTGIQEIKDRKGGAQGMGRFSKTPGEQLSVDWAVRQTNPAPFFKQGLSGRNVRVGVIDAGFVGAHENNSLSQLFRDSLILDVRDFLEPFKKDHFGQASTHSDWHGALVLEKIAGKDSSKNKYHGLGTNASFVLARTEHGDREFRGEEDLWVNALEWMDSLGVRLVNTSLGYGMDFDNPEENYTPEQMNGSTAFISKAAQIAVEQKGVFIVAAAGNEGMNGDWKVVSAPADAQGVLAVGATNKVGLKASYSSFGPDFLPYLKPNVSCYSPNGTSFSAPIITGFVACLLEAYPNASNEELSKAIQQSAYLYPYGNRQVGYGVPQAQTALDLLQGQDSEKEFKEMKAHRRKRIIFRNTKKRATPWSTAVLLFHKVGDHKVVKDKVRRTKRRRLRIRRPNNGATRTTVLFPDNSGVEIWWSK